MVKYGKALFTPAGFKAYHRQSLDIELRLIHEFIIITTLSRAPGHMYLSRQPGHASVSNSTGFYHWNCMS